MSGKKILRTSIWWIAFLLFVLCLIQNFYNYYAVSTFDDVSFRYIFLNPRVMFFIVGCLMSIILYMTRIEYINVTVKIRYIEKLTAPILKNGIVQCLKITVVLVIEIFFVSIMNHIHVEPNFLKASVVFFLLIFRMYISYMLVYFVADKSLVAAIYVAVKYFLIYLAYFIISYYHIAHVIMRLIDAYYFDYIFILAQNIVFSCILIAVSKRKEII